MKLGAIFVFLVLSSALVFAHGNAELTNEENHEGCPMHEQMEETYGEEFMNNMHNSMHKEFANDKDFQRTHNSMHNPGMWNLMRTWMGW